MPKLPIVSSRELIRILERTGLKNAPKRGKGSHRAFIKTCAEGTRLVIVPDRDELPQGTLLAILKQAGIDRPEFLMLLNK